MTEYYDLETAAAQSGSELKRALIGGIMDSESHNQQPFIDGPLAMDYSAVVGYAADLTKVILDTSSIQTELVTVRALNFGLFAGSKLLPEGVDLDIHSDDLDDGHTSPEDTKRRVIDESSEYLRHRPTLRNLVNRHLIILDPANHGSFLAQIVAGHALKLVDDGARRYISEETAAELAKLEAWDGTHISLHELYWKEGGYYL